jgi:predicted GTPase
MSAFPPRITFTDRSKFINAVSGENLVKVGHTSESCTSDIHEAAFRMKEHQVQLIDTPGFDDTNLTDTEVLKKIATWMEVMYGNFQ